MPKFWAVPTIHPAAIMKDQEMTPVVINDLKKSLAQAPEHYNLFPTIEEAEAFNATEFAIDIETNYFKRGEAIEIKMVGLSTQTGMAIILPFRGPYIEILKRIAANARLVVGQNILMFDEPILKQFGVVFSKDCRVYDIMLAHHLRFPSLPHDLEFIASMFTTKPNWKSQKGDCEELYCSRDVDVTWQSYLQLKPLLEAAGLARLHLEVSTPLARICKLMEDTGFKIDTANIDKVRAQVLQEMLDEEQYLPEKLRTKHLPIKKRAKAPKGTVSEKTGKPIKFIQVDDFKVVTPWKSGPQVARYLYEDLGLEKQFDLKTGEITTGKMALDKLARQSGFRSIKALRILRKKGATVNNFIKKGLAEVDRVHTHFNVHGTSSGRLSSSDPNLQNVPESVRYIYVPSEPGWEIFDCVIPSTKILKSDLTWVSAEKLIQGDTLIGFEADVIKHSRRFSKSIVTNIAQTTKPCLKITTNKGALVVSRNHPFLWKNRNKGRNYEWRIAEKLKEGEQIGFLFSAWDSETSYEGGWLAGFLDGEGHIQSGHQVGFGQNPGVALTRAKELLAKLGFTCNEYGKNKCQKVHIASSTCTYAGLKLLGMIRPSRLLPKVKWEGSKIWGRHSEPATVLRIEDMGAQEVIALETSTHTFVADGFFSHNCDFSQIENRLTAWFAGDTERLKRLEDPKFSEHKWAASQFFHIPYDEVEKDNDKDAPYGKAKRIVHGNGYGMGAKKIAMMYDMDFGEVKELLFKWKSAIGKTTEWQERTSSQAHKQGYLTNPFGRRRWFYTSSWYTESLSFLPQSTAADIIFRAMLGLLYERIGLTKTALPVKIAVPLPTPARILLQVHDSLPGECPTDQIQEVHAVLKEVMCQPWPELSGFSIPISFKTGDSWGACA